jgi:hypothetical protein
MVTFVKGPGHDWTVRYRFEGEPVEAMSVFGRMTIEEAAKEARYSLDGLDQINAGTYEILAIERAHESKAPLRPLECD